MVLSISRLLLLLALTCVHAVAAARPSAPVRVGAGDVRDGYADAGFVTRTRSLDATAGATTETSGYLLSLVRSPPLGLPSLDLVRVPGADGIALGRRLFFDRRLSFNATLSCAMCHIPEQAFTQNELMTPVGFQGRAVKRNAPALYNVAYRKVLFFDGREETLEQQIWSPILAGNEMAMPAMGTLLSRLRDLDEYESDFREAYGEGINARTLGYALADYQRALLSADSPFDRWKYGNEENALPEEAQRGFRLFTDAGCAACHLVEATYAHFTDDDFHDTGIGYAAAMSSTIRVQLAPGVFVDVDRQSLSPAPVLLSDLGRYEATGIARDRWKYRTPSLRNVALTPPYMHNGSLATLAEVVDFYDRGGVPHDGLDPRIRPLGLTGAQKADLVAFLESLTGRNVNSLARDARAAPIGDIRGAER